MLNGMKHNPHGHYGLRPPRRRFNPRELATNSALEYFDFSYMNLADVDFNGLVLWNVSFVGASLVGADFQHCSICYADFSNANLLTANFSRSHLRNSLFQDANLAYTALDGVHVSVDDRTSLQSIQLTFPGWSRLVGRLVPAKQFKELQDDWPYFSRY